MTPANNTAESELNLETKRITVSMDEVTEKIIDNLIGVKGKSKSNVVYEIIKDWIDQNAEKILKNWGVNFADIRKQVMASYKREDQELIEYIAELFQTIKTIQAEELASVLDMDEKELMTFIFKNRVALEKVGLSLQYEEGKFFSKDS